MEEEGMEVEFCLCAGVPVVEVYSTAIAFHLLGALLSTARGQVALAPLNPIFRLK